MTLTTVATKTTNVVTLIPPPVPAGAAPMNIKITVRSFVISCSLAISTEAKPAVRALVDWKKETNNFWKKFFPSSVLFHSKARKPTVPMTSRATVMQMATRECRFSGKRFFFFKLGNSFA